MIRFFTPDELNILIHAREILAKSPYGKIGKPLRNHLEHVFNEDEEEMGHICVDCMMNYTLDMIDAMTGGWSKP